MADIDSLENELKKAQERMQRKRLAVQKIKRVMLKRKRGEKRNIEAQALCALGRAVVESATMTATETMPLPCLISCARI